LFWVRFEVWLEVRQAGFPPRLALLAGCGRVEAGGAIQITGSSLRSDAQCRGGLPPINYPWHCFRVARLPQFMCASPSDNRKLSYFGVLFSGEENTARTDSSCPSLPRLTGAPLRPTPRRALCLVCGFSPNPLSPWRPS
jgi:hypothetical protein